MSPRNFLVLAGATAVSLALAAAAVISRDVPVTATPGGSPLVAGLLDRANEVRTIKITGPGAQTLTLAGGDGGWRVPEKGDFPAKPTEARELVLQLANLQLVEAKTAQADRLPRLELEDPGAEGTKSKLVELFDADGKPVASAVVGKTRLGLYGGGRSGVYVRRPGDPQAWLAAGTLELPSDALDLVDVQVIDVPMDQVARVVLNPGGTELVMHRPDAAINDFKVDTPLPEGRTLDQSKVEEVAGMLAAVSMQDVKPAKDLTVPPDARRSRVETFDGLVVEATLAKAGEGDAAESWLLLDATAKQPAAAPPAAATSPTPDAGKPAEPTPDAAQAPKPAEPTAADKSKAAAEQAAALKARVAGWAFKVPTYLGDRFGTTLDGLLAEPGSS